MAMNIIASNIISSQISKATVIDTTGRFSIMRLHQVFLQHLREVESVLENAKVEAEKLLNRVNIIRTFDFTGMVEAVAEIEKSLEKNIQPSFAGETQESPKTTIPDSEDEDDDMLLDVLSDVERTRLSKTDVSLLVIDELSRSPNVPGIGSSAHTALYAFLTALSFITAEHNIVTLVLRSFPNRHPQTQGAPDVELATAYGSYFDHFFATHIVLRSNVDFSVIQNGLSRHHSQQIEFV
jgi:hypothetical protein